MFLEHNIYSDVLTWQGSLFYWWSNLYVFILLHPTCIAVLITSTHIIFAIFCVIIFLRYNSGVLCFCGKNDIPCFSSEILVYHVLAVKIVVYCVFRILCWCKVLQDEQSCSMWLLELWKFHESHLIFWHSHETFPITENWNTSQGLSPKLWSCGHLFDSLTLQSRLFCYTLFFAGKLWYLPDFLPKRQYIHVYVYHNKRFKVSLVCWILVHHIWLILVLYIWQLSSAWGNFKHIQAMIPQTTVYP